MKTIRADVVSLFLGAFSLPALAQAVPAGVAPVPSSLGFHLPTVGGTLSYSISASQSINKGYYGSGISASTGLSGNLAFLTQSQRYPFSMVYSGGKSFSNSNSPSPYFQNLAFSQVLPFHRWNFVFADSVNYIPETPTTGLSGIPGVGDLSVDPVQVGNTDGLGILTNYGARVNNTVSVGVSHPLSANLSLQGGGNYTTLHYLGDNSGTGGTSGLNSMSEGGSGGLGYRIDARSSLSVNYSYNRSSFGGSAFSFINQGVSASYSRQFNRALSMNLSGGPQRSSSSDTSILSGPSTNVGVGAGLSYTTRRFASSLSYARGTNNGSGVLPGAVSDSITTTLHPSLGRVWSLSGSVGYSRNRSLPNLTVQTFSSDAVTTSVQVSRSISRHLSSFASYSFQDQILQNTAAVTNAFSGHSQVISFGVSYSPSTINLSRR